MYWSKPEHDSGFFFSDCPHLAELKEPLKQKQISEKELSKPRPHLVEGFIFKQWFSGAGNHEMELDSENCALPPANWIDLHIM